MPKVLIGALIFACVLVNLATPYAFFAIAHHDQVWESLLLGICIGEVNLIATWAALASGNVLLRLPWSMLLGVIMWYALIIGNRMLDAIETWSGGSIYYHSSFGRGEAVLLGIVLLA